jgi:hypothetical protein
MGISSPLKNPEIWRYRRGDFTDRRLINRDYGTSIIHGIAPSRNSSHIVLYAQASDHGYSAGWREDGLYEYMGVSRLDERTERPAAGPANFSRRDNNTLLTSWRQGRPLQLLERKGRGPRPFRYVDSFILHDWFEKDVGDGAYVPIFLLRPVEEATHAPHPSYCIHSSEQVQLIPVERHALLSTLRDGSADHRSMRPEARLEKSFCLFMLRQGYPVWRFEIRHTVGCHPLYTDVWVGGVNLLLETKAKADRDHVRQALAQLIDYTRFLSNPYRAVLVPERPEGDLLKLAHTQQAAVIWPGTRGNWESSAMWLSHLGITYRR